jgi:hypothetical protein
LVSHLAVPSALPLAATIAERLLTQAELDDELGDRAEAALRRLVNP